MPFLAWLAGAAFSLPARQDAWGFTSDSVDTAIYSAGIPPAYAMVDSNFGYEIYVNLGQEDGRVTALRRCRVSCQIEEL
jgi:hypothetical protein